MCGGHLNFRICAYGILHSNSILGANLNLDFKYTDSLYSKLKWEKKQNIKYIISFDVQFNNDNH